MAVLDFVTKQKSKSKQNGGGGVCFLIRNTQITEARTTLTLVKLLLSMQTCNAETNKRFRALLIPLC